MKCQFCEYFVKSSRELREGLSYLENGFAKINGELDDLERKVHLVIGFIFRRHKYAAEDLLDSAQMNRIQSLAGKIKDDVSRWDAAGKLPYRLKTLYNENAESVQGKMFEINRAIQERKPTLWERVGGFFRRLYRIIVENLPILFKRLLTVSKQKSIKDKEAA
jgi:hypothetical protein